MAEVTSIDEQAAEYINKHAALLLELGDPVTPYRFYREIFPESFLQDAYRVNPAAKHDGKFVAIANVIHERKDGGVYRRNHYVLDDLTQVTKWTNQVAFLSPCSFLGGAKDLEHLRYLHAFVVDLDYVGVQQLVDVFHQCQIGFLPTPTYVVNSGTGLHLYYVLEKPVTCYKKQQECYNALKHALIDLCWNEYTSKSVDRQYSGLVQPYRIPGTRTKLDVDRETQKVVTNDFPVTAFRYGGKWTIDALLDWEPHPNVGTCYYIERCTGIRRMLCGEIDGFEITPNGHYAEHGEGRVSIEEAKERWPEWYDRRILHGEPPKDIASYKWHVSPRVYEWWLRKIKAEAKPGHRYHCIMCLAIYAIKCDVPYAKLKDDAYSLLEAFDDRTNDETNHFHASDIAQALKAYRSKVYATFPIGSIEYFSGLHIGRNKRRGRDQQTHLVAARAVQNVLDPHGKWRNRDGAPTKRDLVRAYAMEHPEDNHSEIARALDVSRPTVIKWLKPGWRDEWNEERERNAPERSSSGGSFEFDIDDYFAATTAARVLGRFDEFMAARESGVQSSIEWARREIPSAFARLREIRAEGRQPTTEDIAKLKEMYIDSI